MNKSDIKLILIILIFSFLVYIVFNSNNSSKAYVYFNNDKVLTIDLNKNGIYSVTGLNGEVQIEVKSKKLRVIKEESPLHLCSSEGFKNKGSIVCLPNKIVITFDNEELDAVIG